MCGRGRGEETGAPFTVDQTKLVRTFLAAKAGQEMGGTLSSRDCTCASGLNPARIGAKPGAAQTQPDLADGQECYPPAMSVTWIAKLLSFCASAGFPALHDGS
jgi:hypothetical protein